VKIINKGIISAVAIAASALAASAAQASDGTITVNGAIAAQTCTINGGTTGDVTVTLPTVQSTAFAAAGSTAGRTGFQLALTNCLPATGNVYAFFEQGATIDNATGNLINQAGAGAATNVQVQFLNAADGSPIAMNQAVGAQGAAPASITTGAATLRYAAQYVAVGGIPTTGPVTTTVVYSLHYN